MTDPGLPEDAGTPAPAEGPATERGAGPATEPSTAGTDAPAPRAKRSSTPRNRSTAGSGKATGAAAGKATAKAVEGPAAEDAPTPARAKRTTSTSGTARPKRATSASATGTGTAAERPKRTPARTAAAQSTSDTVRPPRGSKSKATPAQSAPAESAPPEDDDETATKLLPAAHPPAVAPPADEETTEILAPSPDGADAPTEILRPAPAREGADETTEILAPAALAAAAPAAAESDAPPAHVRGQVDEGPEPAAQPSPEDGPEVVLRVRGLSKRFGTTLAVDRIDLDVQAGSFAGIVGPNGAGKTTTLSMVTGLLRPDVGSVQVHGIDVWHDPERAKRAIGVLPDALRLFDRLTGAQLLHYSGVLRGLDEATVRQRSADLVRAFGLEDATGRVVADYSAGMTKKIALAAAMIHSPRLLVLDEPFESVDPVSAANIIEILRNYVASGGTVLLSSHGMDLIQRICDHVVIIVGGRVLAAGTTDEVRAGRSLEDRFVELAGGRKAAEGMEWLHSFTD